MCTKQSVPGGTFQRAQEHLSEFSLFMFAFHFASGQLLILWDESFDHLHLKYVGL